MKRVMLAARWSCLALLAALSAPVLAQAWPAKPIKVIVPYPPGGGNDIVVRTLANRLTESLGQPVLVENKPGGGTLIGAEAAAKSPPDGYTIFLGTIATLSINPSLFKQLPYNPAKDFTPVSQIVNYPLVLIANPSVPTTSVKELLALAKAKPGQMSYASFGNGSSPHLGTELLKTMTGVDIVHVPYKGGAPALADLLGGQVAMMFVDLPPALSHIRSGKVRAIAVSPLQRTALMPEVPTVAETVPGFGFSSWAGLLVPAGTPAEIVNRLHAEIARILNLPEVKQQLTGLGAEPVGSTPQQFAELIRSETAKWSRVVKDSGAKVD